MPCDEKLCWLPFLQDVPGDAGGPAELAQKELAGNAALLGGKSAAVSLLPGAGDGYEILERDGNYLVRGGETGVLYGAYRLLTDCYRGESPLRPWTMPAFSLRMLNHWDNMDGSVERGYAGKSLFFAEDRFAYDPARIRRYGRLLASIGVNAVCINNVNVHAPADQLITERLLPKTAALADLLRPFGVRLLLAVDYALPVTQGLPTADPLDEKVQAFWNRQCDLIYQYIPDFLGFLVKADSEFRPGPFLYHRSHAEGANLLARALKPHGGKVIWRCFVYNCRQDWRDHATDRPMAAYRHYAPLDGQFEDNVILQVKNGPYDFQVREPASPLFYAMPNTVKALEVQLAQEYTGQQIDLYYMPPMWEEWLSQVPDLPDHICAVSNLGNDENWTGHFLAQANLYAYGRFAWLGRAFDGKAAAREWIALTLGSDFPETERLLSMLLRSRGVYEKYTSPLGLCWMVNISHHYGPSPEGYEFSLWGTYHRADYLAVGIDRTEKGTGYTRQYPKELAEQYESMDTCPEEMLLFFHRVRYDHMLRDGRTLLQRIYDDHFEGAEEAEGLLKDWVALQPVLPDGIYAHTLDRFRRQVQNAREWRDVINTYFHRFTGTPDAKGRTIYD